MTDLFVRDVWRAIALETELDLLLSKVGELLQPFCQPDLIMLRRLEPATNRLQTVASVPKQAGQDTTPSPIKQHEAVLNWFFTETLITGTSAQVPVELAELIPPQAKGQLLVGPLNFAGQPMGVLIWLRQQRAFSQKEQQMFRLLQDPLATAVVNYRQLHELRNLREKAEADNRSLLSRLDRQDISASIIGAETGLKSVCERIELLEGADIPVLILGETGSGKEVVARALHTRSRRANGPFLRVNCGAIPPELIDSHLFGHERGSFSGAEALRKGWFERADGGTLFLDEIGDLPLPAQVRLLRVLQDGTFERVGGQRPLTVDVRIIAATHRDLQTMVAAGEFREDLWYRIAVFPISIPPLRERQEDIPALATHFALRAAKRLGAMPLNPGPSENRLLMAYKWPGNVRELAAVIERAVILGNGRSLEVSKALGLAETRTGQNQQPPPGAEGEAPEFVTLDMAISQHIEQALAMTDGRIEGKTGAARLLGINPNTLRAKMRRLGVDWKRFRRDL